jgi:CRISPR type I-E-associated protein CasB/Cse2
MHVDAWPVVAALGGDIGQPVYVHLAALFATHPEESSAWNLGETCRQISLGEDLQLTESSERRFRRLLACGGDVEEVLHQLPTWVRLAAGKGVGINYEVLLGDLLSWPWSADEIRVRWARSFWRSGEESPAASANSESTRA